VGTGQEQISFKKCSKENQNYVLRKPKFHHEGRQVHQESLEKGLNS
jgi:hypothetical protein